MYNTGCPDVSVLACRGSTCISFCDIFFHKDELGVSRELMFNLPMEKKWELYLSKQKVSPPLTCRAAWLHCPVVFSIQLAYPIQ